MVLTAGTGQQPDADGSPLETGAATDSEARHMNNGKEREGVVQRAFLTHDRTGEKLPLSCGVRPARLPPTDDPMFSMKDFYDSRPLPMYVPFTLCGNYFGLIIFLCSWKESRGTIVIQRLLIY